MTLSIVYSSIIKFIIIRPVIFIFFQVFVAFFSLLLLFGIFFPDSFISHFRPIEIMMMMMIVRQEKKIAEGTETISFEVFLYRPCCCCCSNDNSIFQKKSNNNNGKKRTDKTLDLALILNCFCCCCCCFSLTKIL